MVMSTLWSPSRVEMRTAWLEEHGIGACSGSEFHLARERRLRENIPPNPTGTHTAAGMLTLIPVLFVSPSPIPSSHLFCPPLCLTLSWSLTPHPMSLRHHRRCCPYLPYLFFSPCMCTTPTYLPPMYLVCMAPPPLYQNGVYGASDRLHPRPEVHHRTPGWRRQQRLR